MNDTHHKTTGKRREDKRFTTGRGQYTDDMRLDGALHTVFLRSPYASATIRSIDTSAALAHPGVAAVLTGADLDAEDFNDCPTPYQFNQGDGTVASETPRPYLVRKRVRFVGEPVAMVLAESYAAAQDAAELIAVDYEEQAAVADVFAANKADAPQLWDDRPCNVAYHWRGGDMAKVDAALATSHHVARLKSHVSRVVAMPLEPRAALAYMGQDGRPVLQLAHQSPYQVRTELAKLFKLEAMQLRVLVGDVGGSFGMKGGVPREEVLVFWAALRLKRPVRWTALRSESFLADEHARDVFVTSELGLDADGRFTALRVRYDVNVGAYMRARSTPPVGNIGTIVGVYTTPCIAGEVVGIFTNTQTPAPYRGAGRPDATYAIERIIDVAAYEMGIDPAALRRRNLIPAQAMPYRTPFIMEYDSGDFEPNLDKALELAAYADFPRRREEAKKRGRLRGIGIAMPIEKAGSEGSDRARIRANPDGTFTLTTGSMSVGQGHETGLSCLVAQRLGISPSKVRYEQGDTDLLESGKGNGGSSALIMAGAAVSRSLDELIEKGRQVASRHLAVPVSEIEFAEGLFRVAGTDRAIHMSALAQAAEANSPDGEARLAGAAHFVPKHPTFPNGCHICEVEIDPETGVVTPISYVSVEDVGRVVNPVLVEGQIHGGVAQGIGQALFEEIRYDESGQLVTGAFTDYAMPRASDMPVIVSANLEVPTVQNPLGVKGVGEAGTVGALSATVNAVCNALGTAGIRHLDMPATPMRVWQALQEAGYRDGAN